MDELNERVIISSKILKLKKVKQKWEIFIRTFFVYFFKLKLRFGFELGLGLVLEWGFRVRVINWVRINEKVDKNLWLKSSLPLTVLQEFEKKIQLLSVNEWFVSKY